ncbi:MAG: 4Fe-4S dicluster domain-containing protein [Proteobacteria bacterium]|nr:4Fe-4S dicluster domain-containing protein [Pseudomonadota bacterium]
MSPIVFQTALYASLALCGLGLLWRCSAWFRIRIGPDARGIPPSRRVAAAFRGAASALFSTRLFGMVGAFFLDVLLQRRLFANAKLRWLAHLMILAGFTLLLLTHALAAIVAATLLPGYQPTLDPYLFLRNFAGAMVLAGTALLFFGRLRRRSGDARMRRPVAAAFVALLALVIVSGYLLEAHKMASPRAFDRMAQQYTGAADAGELGPLRALWAREFGVAFIDLKETVDPDSAEKGRALHLDACASCHTRPNSAFVSFPLSRALAPAAARLDGARADAWLHYLHVFACFLGLATLPFTRFFHAVAAPVSLLVDGAAPARDFTAQACSPELRASRRALALDACVQCGMCDAHCSVAPIARYLGNPYLLPSPKLRATGALAGGRMLRAGQDENRILAAEGAFLCTDCGRCTEQCPVGLDLKDMWEAGRADLAAAGLPSPAQWVQAHPASAWAESLQAVFAQQGFSDADMSVAPLSAERSAFSRCVQCQTCTNVCPVVAHSMDTEHGVDLTPQKVMNLLRLGLRDLTLGSRMVWSCATCYQCQEHCPEGIRVADIMCELRALAVRRLGAVRSRREAA